MELPDKDQPSEDIWLDPEAINAHFDTVKQRYEDESGGGSGKEPIETGPMFELDPEISRLKDGG